ncbi:MAG: HD domain-containing protein [Hyphomicrobiaceae bacterium]
MPPTGIERWRPAWMFAGEAHRSQLVPGGAANYLAHLGAVTMEILAAHLVEPLEDLDLAVQCAILHDTIEDQGITHAVLEGRFGTDVADGVQALSKDPDLSKAEGMRDSLARIQSQPRSVWCVKLADRITNLHGVPAHWTPEKIAFYRDEAIAIHAALGSAHRHLASRLEARIQRYPDSE